MRITCALSDFDFLGTPSDLDVVLFGNSGDPMRGSAGTALKHAIMREKVTELLASIHENSPLEKS